MNIHEKVDVLCSTRKLAACLCIYLSAEDADAIVLLRQKIARALMNSLIQDRLVLHDGQLRPDALTLLGLRGLGLGCRAGPSWGWAFFYRL